jgi:2'-5' RNA ligase
MRVFAGLPIPEGQGRIIGDWMNGCKHTLKGFALVRPENLHLTLFFFGEKNQEEVDELVKALQTIRFGKITASLSGLGQFPRRGTPRVIFLDMETGREEVISLYRSFLSKILPLGYHEDRRGFTPHITIGRNRRGRPVPPLPAVEQALKESFVIDRLILYESKLNPGGAVYAPISTTRAADVSQ